MLETACEDFEVLQRLIRQETRLGSGSGLEDHRATVCVRMALDLKGVINPAPDVVADLSLASLLAINQHDPLAEILRCFRRDACRDWPQLQC